MTKKQKMSNINYKYGDIIQVNINEVTSIDDSLSVELTFFTHKRPHIGGTTMVTAYLTISKGADSEEIRLSQFGKEGKSRSEDGLTEEERFTSVLWKEYKFQLVKISYSHFIEIIVYKN